MFYLSQTISHTRVHNWVHIWLVPMTFPSHTCAQSHEITLHNWARFFYITRIYLCLFYDPIPTHTCPQFCAPAELIRSVYLFNRRNLELLKHNSKHHVYTILWIHQKGTRTRNKSIHYPMCKEVSCQAVEIFQIYEHYFLRYVYQPHVYVILPTLQKWLHPCNNLPHWWICFNCSCLTVDSFLVRSRSIKIHTKYVVCKKR